MSLQASIVHACPGCGQGGLEIVRLRSRPPREAVVCAECDRIWLDSTKVGFQGDEQLMTALPEIGLSGDWSDLERLQVGVPWERLDEQYQAFLERRSGSSGQVNQ